MGPPPLLCAPHSNALRSLHTAAGAAAAAFSSSATCSRGPGFQVVPSGVSMMRMPAASSRSRTCMRRAGEAGGRQVSSGARKLATGGKHAHHAASAPITAAAATHRIRCRIVFGCPSRRTLLNRCRYLLLAQPRPAHGLQRGPLDKWQIHSMLHTSNSILPGVIVSAQVAVEMSCTMTIRNRPPTPTWQPVPHRVSANARSSPSTAAGCSAHKPSSSSTACRPAW